MTEKPKFKKKSDWSSHDVIWWSKKHKKPIAYSTKADSDAISLINEPNMTANDLLAKLTSGEFLVSKDCIAVIEEFVKRGLGNELIVTRDI